MSKLLVLALVSALLGAAVVGATGMGGTPTAKQAAAKKKKSSKAKVVKRGPRGLRGKTGVRGLTGAPGPQGAVGDIGPQGPAATDVARSLRVRWTGSPEGGSLAAADLPGIGRLEIECSPQTQQLRVVPATSVARVVTSAVTFEGTDSTATSSENAVQLPVNGMIEATVSAQPREGDGGSGPAPATLLLTSERKLNDPSPGANFCRVAAQVVQEG